MQLHAHVYANTYALKNCQLASNTPYSTFQYLAIKICPLHCSINEGTYHIFAVGYNTKKCIRIAMQRYPLGSKHNPREDNFQLARVATETPGCETKQ